MLNLQYVKKMFETNKGNFSGSKPIIGREIGPCWSRAIFLHTITSATIFRHFACGPVFSDYEDLFLKITIFS
jgi:hypothetical protein